MNIITLTVNPALDKSAKVDGLVAEQKLKCHSISYQAGGGGVNISKILTRLQVKSNCIITLGGDNGNYLQKLLIADEIILTAIPIKGFTRENFSVVDTKTNFQYRFGMPGTTVSKEEQSLILNVINEKVQENDLFALSGSLSENMPLDFYAQIIKSLEHKNVKIILDTSGPALLNTLNQNVFLIKPNQKELALLADKDYLTDKEQEDFAMQLVSKGKVKFVVVSRGSQGAFIASKEGVYSQNVPQITVKSTIGAGDSMVAGLIYGIEQKLSPKKMLKFGVACGTATTMSEGTNLGSASTIKNIYNSL